MCVSCIPWASCTGCSVLSDNRVPTCVAILDHTSSLEPTGTLETLSLDSGYWRTSNTSRNILTCYRETACAGGSTVEEYCSSGYEGPCKSEENVHNITLRKFTLTHHGYHILIINRKNTGYPAHGRVDNMRRS